METPKLKKIISAIYLDLITGDVHIRNQYLNTFLTHVTVYIRMAYLNPRQPAIEKFRSRLHNAVSMILHNAHPLPAADTKREGEIRQLEKYFDRFVIRIDEKVADDVGLDQVGLIEDIETIEYCRNICYSATSDYSSAMAGNPLGLTDATNKIAFIMNLMTPIVYRYSMVDISESDFANAARAAAKRIESQAAQIEGGRQSV
jgi:hypothetical protein